MSEHDPMCPVADVDPASYDYETRDYYDCTCVTLRACRNRTLDDAYEAVTDLPRDVGLREIKAAIDALRAP